MSLSPEEFLHELVCAVPFSELTISGGNAGCVHDGLLCAFQAILASLPLCMKFISSEQSRGIDSQHMIKVWGEYGVKVVVIHYHDGQVNNITCGDVENYRCVVFVTQGNSHGDNVNFNPIYLDGVNRDTTVEDFKMLFDCMNVNSDALNDIDFNKTPLYYLERDGWMTLAKSSSFISDIPTFPLGPTLH